MRFIKPWCILVVLFCLTAVACAGAAEVTALWEEHGYADWQVLCGSMLEDRETSYAFLITESGGERSLTGLQWSTGASDVRIESYGSCGLALEEAVSITALNEGSNPIDRRFVLRMADGSSWEFVSTFRSGWRVYRYTGPDGFVCTLNSGRLSTPSAQAVVAQSSWLGNWPDLSRFPKSEKEAAVFARQCWESTGGRSLVWGAHLRQKPSASSQSLGKVHVALAEVLEEKPGSNLPWYRVKIGSVTGWVSGPYVVSPLDTESFAHNGSLGIPWAKPIEACDLCSAMNERETIRTLPAETFLQVLAQTESGWAYVLATNEPRDFSLSAEGEHGYVRLEAIEIHSPWNALQ